MYVLDYKTIYVNCFGVLWNENVEMMEDYLEELSRYILLYN